MRDFDFLRGIVLEDAEKMQEHENKMGVMPVGRLLVNMALPTIISMLVMALYNIVDSVFVAWIDEDALAALSLAFPMQNLMIGTATGLGVGINALISRALGEKDRERAEKTAMQGLLLEIIGFAAFCITGAFFARAFIESQTDSAAIIGYGSVYIKICCCFGVGMFVQISFERTLQATGRTFYTMITQMTGAIINVIFDPILIFGLLGAPKLGVAGAAIATVMGQAAAGVLAFIFTVRKNPDVTLHVRNIRPNRTIILQVLSIGVPSILMVSISSVMSFCINRILIAFTSTAVAVFGIYFKLQGFMFMPIFGLNNGMVPIVSYNYGARHKERMLRAIKLSMAAAECIMLCGLAVFELVPDRLFMLFSASEDMLAIGVPALRIMAIAFSVAGICVICGSVCQALSKGLYSLYIAIGRQLVVLVPAAYLLAHFGGLAYVWWAWPIAEIVSLLLSLYFVRRTIRNLDWGRGETP
jgi:putative MATE family efflux protein